MNTNLLFRLGTGCGIEVRDDDLLVVAVKSRPKGVTVLGREIIKDFRHRPPEEWGVEYAAFLKERGLSHLAATVSLPRGEVIVRQIQMPPVTGKDLAAAVGYQIETLHPFGEDEVCWSHAALRAPGEGAGELPVGVVIAEKSKVDAYADLFEAAGIAVSSFSVTAAAFFAGIRVRWDSPPVPFLITYFHHHKLEIYGEGENRPLFSAEFDLASLPAKRALQLAEADLRLAESESALLAVCGQSQEGEDEQETPRPLGAQQFEEGDSPFEWRSIAEILPTPSDMPLNFDLRRDAAALAVGLESACPRLGWRVNLLPRERRKSSSRWMYAPTAALTVMVFLLLIAFAMRPTIQNRSYVEALEADYAGLAPVVEEANATQQRIVEAKRKTALLGSLEARTEIDMRTLAELSDLIPDTAWLKSLELDDNGLQMSGEARSAAPLLAKLSDSRYVMNAAFSTSLREIQGGQRFQITAKRVSSVESGTVQSGGERMETVGGAAEAPTAPEAAQSATLTTMSEQDPTLTDDAPAVPELEPTPELKPATEGEPEQTPKSKPEEKR